MAEEQWAPMAVLDVYHWRAFVVQNGEMQQVLFKGGTDLQMLNTDDHVKSYAVPRVIGSELAASHRHEADPRQRVMIRFRFASNGLVAEQTFFHASVGGK